MACITQVFKWLRLRPNAFMSIEITLKIALKFSVHSSTSLLFSPFWPRLKGCSKSVVNVTALPHFYQMTWQFLGNTSSPQVLYKYWTPQISKISLGEEGKWHFGWEQSNKLRCPLIVLDFLRAELQDTKVYNRAVSLPKIMQTLGVPLLWPRVRTVK